MPGGAIRGLGAGGTFVISGPFFANAPVAGIAHTAVKAAAVSIFFQHRIGFTFVPS